jgi:two-component system, cell cycle sensor histidine kinase and response regulator CckA
MDPSQVDQILVNLCVNARDAIDQVRKGGKVTIETGSALFDDEDCAAHLGAMPGSFVLLAVSDDGCGMDNDTLAHIFEPFFTTKESGKGTGLGLSTVYGIVRQNNGFITVHSEPGGGTSFRIHLPLLAGQQAQIPVREREESAWRQGSGTILLVEDEQAILDMTREMLEGFGYQVLAATTPSAAIALARELDGEIDLLITDVVMPEMSGRELAQHLLQIHPNLKRLFMSGYTANVIANHGVLDEGVSFLEKPFSMKELSAKVRTVLEEGGR